MCQRSKVMQLLMISLIHAPLVHGFTQSSSGDVKGFWYTLLLWQVVWSVSKILGK